MKFITTLMMILFCFSCGKTEKVEGIKGPRGDKGERGEDGRNGETTVVYATPTPTPIQQWPNPDSRWPNPNGQWPNPTITVQPLPPPIIVINRPWPDCNSGNDSRCRSGDTIVCACIDSFWTTIGVNVHYREKLRIKNDGPCYSGSLNINDYWNNDCWGKPQPMPQPQNNRC